LLRRDAGDQAGLRVGQEIIGGLAIQHDRIADLVQLGIGADRGELRRAVAARDGAKGFVVVPEKGLLVISATVILNSADNSSVFNEEQHHGYSRIGDVQQHAGAGPVKEDSTMSPAAKAKASSMLYRTGFLDGIAEFFQRTAVGGAENRADRHQRGAQGRFRRQRHPERHVAG
jgi:hypothetical protein